MYVVLFSDIEGGSQLIPPDQVLYTMTTDDHEVVGTNPHLSQHLTLRSFRRPVPVTNDCRLLWIRASSKCCRCKLL